MTRLLKDFLSTVNARTARPVAPQPEAQQCVPQQPSWPPRLPYTPPGQFGSTVLDPLFDPCGAPPIAVKKPGDST